MKKSLLLLGLFLLAVNLTSQELPKIVPPSPETTSLGKYTDVPVSYYTGLPNISIPITNYRVGGKELTVSIDYHARGIRVEEVSSRVGLGWSLNAGGVIFRQIRSFPDDAPLGIVSQNNILTQSLASGLFFGTDSYSRNLFYSRINGPSDTAKRIDQLPDIFTIKVGNLSAKFFIDYSNGQPILQSYQDLKISYTRDIDGRFDSFKVIDEEGYSYYFGKSIPDSNGNTRSARDREEEIATIKIPDAAYSVINGIIPELLSPDPLEFDTYNTWHLMNIEAPNGTIANYIYTSEDFIDYRRMHEQYICNSYDLAFFNKSRNYQFLLNKIEFESGEVLFENSSILREDTPGSSALGKIVLKDRNGSHVKSYSLNHYFVTNNDPENVNVYFQSTVQLTKRMFLGSINQLDADLNNLPPFEFTYNSIKLPNRFSTAQDYWGFYNGANNGNMLSWFQELCNSSTNGACQDFTLYHYDKNQDRKVDLIKSQAGMLEEIKYPTKGKTKFIYEHNVGKLGPEYIDVILPEINPVVRRDTIISHFDHAIYDGSKYVKNIVISNISGKMKINVSLPDAYNVNQNWACGNPLQNDCAFEMKLIGINGAPSYHYIFAGSQEIEVVSGQYQMIFDPKTAINWDPYPPQNGGIMTNVFEFSLEWYEQPFEETDYLYASGKRINKIEYYDSNNTLEFFKSFSYIDENNDVTGEILGLSSYVEKSQYTNFYTQQFGFIEDVLDFHHNLGTYPGSSLTTYQANSIGYKKVTEYFGDVNTNTGRTVYTFTTHKDGGGDYMKFPYHPPVDNEWLRGKPLTIDIYKKNENNIFDIVKSTQNFYTYGGFPETDAFDLNSYRADYQEGIFIPNINYQKNRTSYRLPLVALYDDFSSILQVPVPYNFCYITEQAYFNDILKYKLFYYSGGVSKLVGTIEKNYFDGKLINSFVNYGYDFNNHYQVKFNETTNSKDEIFRTNYYYPTDINQIYTVSSNEFMAGNSLLLANRFEVLQTDILKNTALQSKVRTNYKDWGNNILLPEKIQTSKGTQTLEDRVVYHSYDSKGNPKEVSKKDGTKIYYVWGYHQTQPIAKIEGYTDAQLSNIMFRINNAISASDNDNTESSENILRTTLNFIRTDPNMVNAQVTTYTYDPLIGVTSITDPRGKVTYYKYDSFNRLENILDNELKILSKNIYNYKN